MAQFPNVVATQKFRSENVKIVKGMTYTQLGELMDHGTPKERFDAEFWWILKRAEELTNFTRSAHARHRLGPLAPEEMVTLTKLRTKALNRILAMMRVEYDDLTFWRKREKERLRHKQRWADGKTQASIARKHGLTENQLKALKLEQKANQQEIIKAAQARYRELLRQTSEQLKAKEKENDNQKES